MADMADEPNIGATAANLSVGAQVALNYFDVAKAEILIRIRVRDTLLATYAAAAFTAIAAILASTELGARYLYGIPYLALAFTLLVSYHHAGIGALGNHCARDLLPILSEESGVTAYEYSNTFHRYHKKSATRRSIAHAMILLLPASIALVVNYRDLLPASYKDTPQYWGLWTGSLVLMAIAILVIHRSNRAHFHGFEHQNQLPGPNSI